MTVARGFFTSGQGNADESRASRFVLKDYVNGKLLYCHPPPGFSAADFNAENWDLQAQEVRKKAPTTRVRKNADTYIHNVAPSEPGIGAPRAQQSRTAASLDSSFFSSPHVAGQVRAQGPAGQAAPAGGFTRSTVPYLKDAVNDDGTVVSARKAHSAGDSSKKHFKPRRAKQRSGRGYE